MQQPKDARWLVFSDRPFDRFALASTGLLTAQSMEMHRRRFEAATLSLLVGADGQLLRAEYGWRSATGLDAPVAFGPGLQWTRCCSERLSGTLKHPWAELHFDVPVQARLEAAGEVDDDPARHPAATTLRRMDQALREQDLPAWRALFQPPDYRPQDDDAAQLAMTRKLIPAVTRIDAVQIDGQQARVRFHSKGRAFLAVMDQTDDGRWMLEQVGPAP